MGADDHGAGSGVDGARDDVQRSRSALALRYGVAIVLLAMLIWATGGLSLPTDLDPIWFVPALATVVVSMGLDAWVWRIYLEAIGSGASYRSLFHAAQASTFASVFLPSPAGSLTRPVYLHGQVDAAPVLGSTLADRINGVLGYGLALLGLVLVVWGTRPDTAWVLIVAAAGGLLVALAVGLLVGLATRSRRGTWFGRIATRMGGLVEASAETIDETLALASEIVRDRPAYTRGLLVRLLAVIGMTGLFGVFFGRAWGLALPLPILFLAVTAPTSLSLLPVLPRGLGASEGFGVVLLAAFGVPAAEALTFYLAVRSVNYSVFVLVGGFSFFRSGIDVLDRLRGGTDETT